MLKQFFQLLLVVTLTGIALRIFVIDSFVVRGNSMSTSVLPGDYVFVNKFAYTFGKEPERNDIVVSRFRKQEPWIIKRVIGLPRERVEITPEKIVIKKSRTDAGVVLEENAYIALANFSLNLPAQASGTTTAVLDPREYFLLGDNRFVSTDSRELGPVDGWDIGGKVVIVFRAQSLSFIKL